MKNPSKIVYPIIIIFCMAIVITFTSIFGCDKFGYTPIYSFLAVTIGTSLEIVIDALVATVIVLLPKKIFNPRKGIYKVSKKELLFYDKIGIKKWKDYVFSEIGFNKKKVAKPSNNEYIGAFLTETCVAETMHLISVFAGFLLVFIFPLSYATSFPIPIAIVNLFLQIPPVFIQRYNRPRLIALYDWNERIAKRTEANNLQSERVSA